MTDSVKQIDDGGQAFPNAADDKAGWHSQEGMSLRDWFAGQALSSVIAQCSIDSDLHRYAGGPAMYFAKKAFEVADMMIAARKAGA